jgi:hypothetical protein
MALGWLTGIVGDVANDLFSNLPTQITDIYNNPLPSVTAPDVSFKPFTVTELSSVAVRLPLIVTAPAVRVPVNVGDALSDLEFTAVLIALNSAWNSSPLITLAALPEGKASLVPKFVASG